MKRSGLPLFPLQAMCLLVLPLCGQLHAVSTEFFEGDTVGPASHPPSDQPDWPRGLLEVVNPKGPEYPYRRVHGVQGNGVDVYSYTGDTVAFNEFLKHYAALVEIPLSPEQIEERKRMARQYAPWLADADYPPPPPHPYPSRPLILHSGSGPNTSSRSGEKQTQVPIDWRMTVRDNVWDSWGPVETIYSIRVEAWTGGNIDITKVEIPLNIEIEAARPGEFKDLINLHEAKRNRKNRNPLLPLLILLGFLGLSAIAAVVVAKFAKRSRLPDGRS